MNDNRIYSYDAIIVLLCDRTKEIIRAPRKASEQSRHSSSQIRVFAVHSSQKHLCTKVTPDFHLTYSKNGGNLGSESK